VRQAITVLVLLSRKGALLEQHPPQDLLVLQTVRNVPQANTAQVLLSHRIVLHLPIIVPRAHHIRHSFLVPREVITALGAGQVRHSFLVARATIVFQAPQLLRSFLAYTQAFIVPLVHQILGQMTARLGIIAPLAQHPLHRIRAPQDITALQTAET